MRQNSIFRLVRLKFFCVVDLFFTPRGNAATSATCSRLFVQCHRRRSRDRLCELCFGSETVLSLCFAGKSNPPTIATFNIQSHTQNSNWTRQYTSQPIPRMARFSVTTALCVALSASSTQAFTGPQYVPATRSAANSRVVLQMNLFDRFARVAKSNLNELANKLEDPEKIMDQAIEEMQVSLFRRMQNPSLIVSFSIYAVSKLVDLSFPSLSLE